MQLTPLLGRHDAALHAFVSDFRAAGEESIPAFFQKPHWSHSETVTHFDAWSEGTPMGWAAGTESRFVTCTTRFLEDEGSGELLGLFNFRHTLNGNLERFGGHVGYSVRPSARRQGHGKWLLKKATEFAVELGLERILVTCAPDNTGSVRVIEACGGSLQDTSYHEEQKTDVCRYWIDLLPEP